MKILNISDPPSFGGAFVAARRIMIGQKYKYWPQYYPNKLDKILGALLPVNPRSFIWSIKQMLRVKPSVVHLHKINTLGISPIIAARLLRIPVVWSIYDYWMLCPRDNLYNPITWKACPGPGARCLICYNPWGKKYPLEFKLTLWIRKAICVWAANRCTRIHAISFASKKLLVKHGVRPEIISVIPIGTPEPAGYKPEKVPGRLLCIAAFGPAKGMHTVFKYANQCDWVKEIILIGSGGHEDYKKHIRELAKSCPTQTAIEDNPPDHIVSDMLQTAEELVVTEQWENPGPLVIGEALIRDTRVSWTDRGGIKECANKLTSMQEMKEGLRCLYQTIGRKR